MITNEMIKDKKAFARTMLLTLYFVFVAFDSYLLFKGKFSYRFCAKPLLMPILATYLFLRKPRLVGIKQDKSLNLLVFALSISWLADIFAVTSNFWLLTISTILYLIIYPSYFLLYFRLYQRFFSTNSLISNNKRGLITLIFTFTVIILFILKVLKIHFEGINTLIFFNGFVITLLLSISISMTKIDKLQSSIYLILFAIVSMIIANAIYSYSIFVAISKLYQLFALTAWAHACSQLMIVLSVLQIIKVKKLTRPRSGRLKNKFDSNQIIKSELNSETIKTFHKFYNELKSQLNRLPNEAKTFSVKALVILSLYLIGDFFLFNTNYWLNRDLTYLTTDITTKSLNWFYKLGFSLKSNTTIGNCEIYFTNSQKVLLISNGCNAFKLYVFYLGFLLCLQGSILKKLIYGILGIVTIFYLNIGRCFALTWLNINNPSLTDFAHHYAFTFIVYATIFFFFWNFLRHSDRVGGQTDKLAL